MILSLGWFAWRQGSGLAFAPVSREPDLITMAPNNALSTIEPEQTSSPSLPTNTLTSNSETLPDNVVTTSVASEAEDGNSGQELLIAARPDKPTEESLAGTMIVGGDRASTTPIPTQALREDTVALTATPPAIITVLTPNPTEGVVGPLPPPPGREAPDTMAGPLQFQRIRIFKDPETNAFAGRANMKNTGAAFLNGLLISWQILGEADQVFDEGELTWPNLAPGETATISFTGTETFVDGWVRVEFHYSP